jgi:23S rRNA (cytosine1962-C5)-methyltransferase
VTLAEAFAAAWDRRELLHADPGTDTYRLFDGLYEGAPGWTVDRYGALALVRRYGDAHGDGEALDQALRDRGLDPRPPPGPSLVREGGLTFEIDALRGRNAGLFLDARPIRRRIRELSHGRRLLNLFAYTCSLGVAAAVGGARSVTNVDLIKSALDRGRANFGHNGLAVDSRSFLRSEVFDFVRQAAKRGERWDAVIADPPPVRTQGRKRGWNPDRDLPRLIDAVMPLIADGGWLLLMSAVKGRRRFEEALPEGSWEPVPRGEDFPGPASAGLRGALRLL